MRKKHGGGPLYYLSSPLTHPDPQVEIDRLEEVAQYFNHLIRTPRVVYCPILSSWWSRGLKTWGEWMEFDFTIIDHCDILLVALIDGWRESKGVMAEMVYAKAKHIPIMYCKLVMIEGDKIDIAVTNECGKLDALPHVKMKHYLGLVIDVVRQAIDEERIGR